ncbi:hypothetical protein AGMMS50239_16160 [Bacteroidia bacterium]|nr:hypothetical protein AGMMS50239_16160 [Bacteroidia bacterium]
MRFCVVWAGDSGARVQFGVSVSRRTWQLFGGRRGGFPAQARIYRQQRGQWNARLQSNEKSKAQICKIYARFF